MEYQDYYAVLGVPKGASEKVVRSAYRKLARRFHPDVNPNNKQAEERFKQINEADEVLSDPEKRKKYDELGPRWQEQERWQEAQAAAGGRRQPVDWQSYVRSTGGSYRTIDEEDLIDDDSPFSDFFQAFFGPQGRATRATRSGPGSNRPWPGQSLEQPVEITLAEAYSGTTRLVELPSANGSPRQIEVKIPRGVDTGSRVRVAGQGMPGRDGGPPGDFYLVTSVRPDSRFERRGDDLFTKVSAPFTTLLLGGETKVTTPDGKGLALKIPAGTQDGRVFVLRGQGMPRMGQPRSRGDLHVEVHARLPERLSQRQRDLIEEFADAEATTAGRR